MFINFESYFGAICVFFLNAAVLMAFLCIFATIFGMPKGKRIRFFMLERCVAAAFGFGVGGTLFLTFLPDFLHPLAFLMALFCSAAFVSIAYISQMPREFFLSHLKK